MLFDNQNLYKAQTFSITKKHRNTFRKLYQTIRPGEKVSYLSIAGENSNSSLYRKQKEIFLMN